MINIYGDESCHLKNDGINTMVLGCIYCDSKKKSEIYRDIRGIKVKNGLNSRFEIKWTKVSNSKIKFYEELIDYFFKNSSLGFRTVVIKDKNYLDHYKYNNDSHDEWYYKMYYQLLQPIINKDNEYRVFVDIKDTLGGPRIDKLFDVLTNKLRDHSDKCLKRIDQIDSKESELLQLADLFIGALGYYHRKLYNDDNANMGKVIILNKLQKEYGLELDKMTTLSEDKFNIFIWTPRKGV